MHTVIPPKVHPVITAVRDAGGRPYLVGGAVRDALIHTDNFIKDLDFEVYHIPIEMLIRTLSQFGTVETVGSSFAVIKLFMGRELNIDFALPRRESKSGRGHRGFLVSADPEMPLDEACARRDFTINAMLMDPFDGRIFDFFGGQKDLSDHVLRHTSNHFDEDPLRPLRAMQFAARFDFHLHEATVEKCRAMADEASTLPEERVFGEWEKWAMYAKFPQRGLEILAAIEWDELFGDLTHLKNQTGGIGWTRTLDAVSRASQLADELYLGRTERLVLMIGALCHALALPAGERVVRCLGTPNVLSKRILPILDAHAAYTPAESVSDTTLLKLSYTLSPECFETFGRLLKSTWKGRIGEPPERLMTRAEALGVLREPAAPIVTGKFLIERGISPGPWMGKMLAAALDAQLNRHIVSNEDAETWLKTYLSKERSID